MALDSTKAEENLEAKLPCSKSVFVKENLYACKCKGNSDCRGKECPTGSNIDVPEGTTVLVPGYAEPFPVKTLPRCDKYSKKTKEEVANAKVIYPN